MAEVAVARTPTATFDDLFRSRYERMVRVAYLLVGSQAEAEEVVQDAFARIELRWAKLDNPEAYLHRCVVNRSPPGRCGGAGTPGAWPPAGSSPRPLPSPWSRCTRSGRTCRSVRRTAAPAIPPRRSPSTSTAGPSSGPRSTTTSPT